MVLTASRIAPPLLACLLVAACDFTPPPDRFRCTEERSTCPPGQTCDFAAELCRLAAGDIGTADLGGADLGASDLGASDLGTADLGPSDFGPDQGPTCPPFPRPRRTLDASIDADLELTCDETFVLEGTVRVEAGATLIIGPGVVVLGEADSLLVVERGGRLIAEGTASAPVVFTSTRFIEAGDAAPSAWGGIALLGSAPVHLQFGTTPERGVTVTVDGVPLTFGGSAPDDSSGTLRYVRIEYARRTQIYAAGSGTTLESVQMLGSNGSLRVWGGSATLKRVLIDDVLGGLDWATGYTGLVQFVLIRGAGRRAGSGC